jgi:hypothetical protein
MPTPTRAKLIELNQSFSAEKPGGRQVEVQFNPESLKVTFANQLVQPSGGDQSAGTAGRQFVGAGTTKLVLQLWFDVTAMEQNAVDDVRRLTQQVIYFMTPQRSDQDANRLAPPGVRFQWGSFLFDGMVEGLEETLEFFSPDGKPLRASINLTLSQQKILTAEFRGTGAVPGRTPMAQARQGDSLQAVAARGGPTLDWRAIATANGVEDPLRLPPGRLLDLHPPPLPGGGSGEGTPFGGSSFGGSAAGGIG